MTEICSKNCGPQAPPRGRFGSPMFWNRRKVFIRGHTGFKGSWLSLGLQQLSAKVCGVALDRPRMVSTSLRQKAFISLVLNFLSSRCQYERVDPCGGGLRMPYEKHWRVGLRRFQLGPWFCRCSPRDYRIASRYDRPKFTSRVWSNPVCSRSNHALTC